MESINERTFTHTILNWEESMGVFVEKYARSAGFLAVLALGLYLGFQYLLPLTGPFILAFLLVYLTYPGLNRLSGKLHIRREILLAAGVIFLAGAGIWGCWAVLKRGADWMPKIYESMEILENRLAIWLRAGCGFAERNFGIDAKEAETVIVEQLAVFSEKMQVNVWPTAAKQSFSWLKKAGGAGAFLGIGFVAALLLCKDYERITAVMRTNPGLEIVWIFLEKTVKMVGGYVKAQLLIICAISAVAVTGLWIGKVDGAFFWGILAGLMDALPFIGTGIILVPLALWQLLNGYFGKTAVCVLCYVCCIAVRELLEPRLLGKQLGISPVIMLFSVYAGVKVFGISGLFLGPLYVMFLREGWRLRSEVGKQ